MDVFAVEKSVGCRFSLSDFVNIGSCFGIILSVYVELNLFCFVILYPFRNIFRYCFLFVYNLLLQCAHFVWYNGDTRPREPTETESRRDGSSKHDSKKNMAKDGKRRLIIGNKPALSRKEDTL